SHRRSPCPVSHHQRRSRAHAPTRPLRTDARIPQPASSRLVRQRQTRSELNSWVGRGSDVRLTLPQALPSRYALCLRVQPRPMKRLAPRSTAFQQDSTLPQQSAADFVDNAAVETAVGRSQRTRVSVGLSNDLKSTKCFSGG